MVFRPRSIHADNCHSQQFFLNKLSQSALLKNITNGIYSSGQLGYVLINQTSCIFHVYLDRQSRKYIG